MLKIGYLVQDFPPETGAGPARVTEMARRWIQAGAEVTVITGLPNRRLPGQPDGVIHPDYRGRYFFEENLDGIRVLRSWLFATPRRGFAWTLVNNASFMMTGAAHALARAGRPDILIASSPPFFVHLAGEVFRRWRRVPLVLEIRDLWPDYLVQMGALRNRFAQNGLFAAERFLLRHAAHSVVVTDSFRRRVIQKGVLPERVDVIPNGVDTAFYRPIDAEPPIAPLVRRGERERIVGYLGTFGAGQALSAIVDAAASVQRSNPDVRFVLAGDGPDRARVVSRAEELRVTNIEFHSPIPKTSTPAFYAHCDVVLVPLAPIPIFQETIPSKIFEIMACERPILASLGGEAARIVEESGGGHVVPPGEPDSIANGILRLLSQDRDERAAMGRKGREYVSRNFSREVLADRYLDILAAVAGSSGRQAISPAAPAPLAAAGGAREQF